MNNKDSSSRLLIAPYSLDPLDVLAERIIQDHKASLPDLSRVHILLPNLEVTPRFRRLLLEKAANTGYQALLGPTIHTLRNFSQHYGNIDSELIDNHSRELLLFNEIKKHPDLFKQANPWTLVNELVSIFDELTLNNRSVPKNIERFIQQLAKAYGLNNHSSALSQEAYLVHTLWHAWHAELDDEKYIEQNAAYLIALANSIDAIPEDISIYLAGFSSLYSSEQTFIQKLISKMDATIVIQGEYLCDNDQVQCHPGVLTTKLIEGLKVDPDQLNTTTDEYTDFINNTFTQNNNLLSVRADEYAQRFPTSNISTRLNIFAANNAEQEAQAIDVQIRQWLLDGHKEIAIITENRRLGRRLRALLERANIPLMDAAGWALSTTSAAATLERWLQANEEDFSYRPLMDLLKSNYILPDWDRDKLLSAVYHLEQDIIHHENVPSGLSRYRKHIIERAKRLNTLDSDYTNSLLELIDTLESASQAFQKLLKGEKARPNLYIDVVLESLRLIGLESSLNEDDAGIRILHELELMRESKLAESTTMTWVEFRTWLGRTMERFNFRQAVNGSQVTLLSLQQSQLSRADALIIASTEREFMPGSGTCSPFFNNAVRSELGLRTSIDNYNEAFYHFRRLLECGNQILITYRKEENGEDIVPCPWVEHLQAFHLLAYGISLQNKNLELLYKHPDTTVIRSDNAPLPQPITCPSPSVDHTLLPNKFSASSYQQLLDCPYQFFAARSLGLSPPETIREALEKADYGEHVHRCLEAFHGGVNGLPGPIKGKLTQQRDKAIKLLETISHTVFAKDLEDNFQHRGWLKKWLVIIPQYIEWQIQQEEVWSPSRVEIRISDKQIDETCTITGRLDRIDNSTSGDLSIIDYKTGQVPNTESVRHGESVQLPYYSLFDEKTTQVQYLALDGNDFGSKSVIKGDELDELRKKNKRSFNTSS
jgi:ATP-dependent helicase/nuclease subunit B